MSHHRFLLGLRLLLTWAAVWPLVMVGLIAVEWLAPRLPFAVRTLVLTGAMVPAISLVIVPMVGRILRWIEGPTTPLSR